MTIDFNKLKKIISAGDLLDRLLINEIKIEKLPYDKGTILRDENDIIQEVLNEISEHVDIIKIQYVRNNLKTVLKKQWDVLDKVADQNLTDAERGRYAVQAQNINVERVTWKNKMNELCGSFMEFKKYGNKTI